MLLLFNKMPYLPFVYKFSYLAYWQTSILDSNSAIFLLLLFGKQFYFNF